LGAKQRGGKPGLNEEKIRELGDLALKEPVYPDPRFPPSLYYRFFKLLAESHKPVLSVVLGVCGGGDCLHLALGWPHGRVVGVDGAWDHPEHIKYIRKECPNFTFMLSDSGLAAPIISRIWGRIDILFIDTNHTYEQTMKELSTYYPLMRKGGVICMDDLFRPGMEDAWKSSPEGTVKIRMDHLHDGTREGQDGGFGLIVV